MLGVNDLPGVAAVIAAIFSGIAAVISALNNRVGRSVRDQVSTNGDPRTLGQIAQDVSKATEPAGDDTAAPPMTP